MSGSGTSSCARCRRWEGRAPEGGGGGGLPCCRCHAPGPLVLLYRLRCCGVQGQRGCTLLRACWPWHGQPSTCRVPHLTAATGCAFPRQVEGIPEEVIFDHLHATAFQHSPLGRTILGPAENVR